MTNMKKISMKEFEEKYMKPSKTWNFNLFDIKCKKCGSVKVEFDGKIGIENGYYDNDSYLYGQIIIKCHDCGNAFTIESNQF